MTLRDELPRSLGGLLEVLLEMSGEVAPEHEEAKPKQKQYPVLDVPVMDVKSDAVKSNTV